MESPERVQEVDSQLAELEELAKLEDKDFVSETAHMSSEVIRSWIADLSEEWHELNKQKAAGPYDYALIDKKEHISTLKVKLQRVLQSRGEASTAIVLDIKEKVTPPIPQASIDQSVAALAERNKKDKEKADRYRRVVEAAFAAKPLEDKEQAEKIKQSIEQSAKRLEGRQLDPEIYRTRLMENVMPKKEQAEISPEPLPVSPKVEDEVVVPEEKQPSRWRSALSKLKFW